MPEVLYRRTTVRARKPGGPMPPKPDTLVSLKALYVSGQISLLEYEQRLGKVLGLV